LRANLTFNLPEEEYAFECAIRGNDIMADLYAIHGTIRSQLKHGHSYKTIDEVLEFICDELEITLSRVKDCNC
jgi:hypothetical protein